MAYENRINCLPDRMEMELAINEKPISRTQLEQTALSEVRRGTRDIDARMAALGALIGSWLKPGSVLDLGCGVGLFSVLAALLGHRVTAIDAAATAVETTRRRAQFCGVYVDTRKLAVEQTDQLEETFDNVLMMDLLEHLEQDDPVVAQAAARLAPGGRVLIAVPAFSRLYGPHDARGDFRSRHFRRYDRRPLVELIERHLQVRRVRYWNLLGLPVRVIENRVGHNFADRIMTSNAGVGAWGATAAGWWLRKVENAVPMPAGLSLLCMAESLRRPSVARCN